MPLQVCLPINLEDDGYNMVHTHDNYAAFILAGGQPLMCCCTAILGCCPWLRSHQVHTHDKFAAFILAGG